MKRSHDFEHMPGALYCKDLEGRYLWCNQGLLDMLHFESFKDVVGKDDWALIGDADEVEHIQAMDQEVINRQEQLTCVEQVKMNGIEQQVVTYKAPLRDEKGKIIGIQGCSLPLEPEHLREIKRSSWWS